MACVPDTHNFTSSKKARPGVFPDDISHFYLALAGHRHLIPIGWPAQVKE